MVFLVETILFTILFCFYYSVFPVTSYLKKPLTHTNGFFLSQQIKMFVIFYLCFQFGDIQLDGFKFNYFFKQVKYWWFVWWRLV